MSQSVIYEEIFQEQANLFQRAKGGVKMKV